MRTTVIGEFHDFAAASQAAAELMVVGYTQAQISVVGREVMSGADDASRFAFAGAVARELAGSSEDDFVDRLVFALSQLCVPPRAAVHHAESLAAGGGLVIIQTYPERASQAKAVLDRYGSASSYFAESPPMARTRRLRPGGPTMTP